MPRYYCEDNCGWYGISAKALVLHMQRKRARAQLAAVAAPAAAAPPAFAEVSHGSGGSIEMPRGLEVSPIRDQNIGIPPRPEVGAIFCDLVAFFGTLLISAKRKRLVASAEHQCKLDEIARLEARVLEAKEEAKLSEAKDIKAAEEVEALEGWREVCSLLATERASTPSAAPRRDGVEPEFSGIFHQSFQEDNLD